MTTVTRYDRFYLNVISSVTLYVIALQVLTGAQIDFVGFAYLSSEISSTIAAS